MAKDDSPEEDPAERIRQDLIASDTGDDVLLTKLAEQRACSCTVPTGPAKPEKPEKPDEPVKPRKPVKPK